jgi:hypothetical protein
VIPNELTTVGLPSDLTTVLERAPLLRIAGSVDELFSCATGENQRDSYEVAYSLPDGRQVVEATVSRVRNGIAVNYVEPHMRRRDQDCMAIGDDRPTDKPRFRERYGYDFSRLREETLEWLSSQELAVFFFKTGFRDLGAHAMAVVPANAGFFALGLAMLQGILPFDSLIEGFKPTVFVLVAPPFRHTHFDGRHEIFSYNLYPGPSAKKGIYGTLIRKGEKEGWIAAHASAVQVVTPYDNVITIMHEGASGGGKSEMLEQPPRLPDGRLRKGINIVTGEERFLEIPRTCDLHPVCDDMALCHPALQKKDGRLRIADAEQAWFVRVDHIHAYGTDRDLEKLTVTPPTPLLFLNIDAIPRSTALIWEHTEDAPGVRCPNPRVIVPRRIYPNIVNRPVAVDIRSMGLRTPPCTREKPSYGIVGLFHVLPPALAWLWRLAVPRGESNPSVVDTDGMSSEGVGSYWPFATGTMVDQANLLYDQFEKTTRIRYILVPNQYVGAWKTGFMPQWLARDYLARRGNARFRPGQLVKARCALLGFALDSMRIEGVPMTKTFLQVDTQPEVGEEGYDAGAAILRNFFATHLQQFLGPSLAPKASRIIQCCLDDGSVEDYSSLLPGMDEMVEPTDAAE